MNKWIKDYLERIEYYDDVNVNLETLIEIHQLHLMHIPFETLDIYYGRKIQLNKVDLYRKIVVQKRGGICFELNGLLHLLLKEIGFDVKLVNAYVHDDPYDHALNLVYLDKKWWLVDVGFGNHFLQPIELICNVVQKDLNGDYIIKQLTDESYQCLKKYQNEWKVEYHFFTQERKLADFQSRCHFFESSRDSQFRKRMCSLERMFGRVTLTDKKFFETNHDIKKETPIHHEKEFNDYLYNYFNIKI